MHDLPLLTNLGVALGAALLGGLVARRIGLQPIVGYLLAGVAIGPFTPGFIGDVSSINQLAELGIVLLMFGVGAHFSFRDLWRVRGIAVPGALLQMAATTALGFALARYWGWSEGASLLLGVAISIASTVVLVRQLMDRGLLDTSHGRIVVGWLVLEDLATVLILVLLPVFAGNGRGGLEIAIWALLKAAIFVALMLALGNRFVPWLLSRVARTRSRELFVLLALTVALGTALASAAFFGVSLALGAFVAGVIVSESKFGHQVTADLLSFRDAFAVLFFVSVGMLVDPPYVMAHWREIAALSVLVILGKAVIAAMICFVAPHPARTGLVVAAGLSQIGEFSFIVGQAGLSLGVLDHEQYSLILACAIVSISLNPLMFRAVDPIERWLKQLPKLWRAIDHRSDDHPLPRAPLHDHIVVVGYGRVGRLVADVLSRLSLPALVVEADAELVDELHAGGVPSLFGDAGSSEILSHACLDRARALVITVPDPIAAELVVSRARDIAPALHIIARAATESNAERLASTGANDTVYPELEGGLEVVRRMLLWLDFPIREVHRYTDTVRRHAHGASSPEHFLEELVRAAEDLELTWLSIVDSSPVAGRTLAESELRARTGVSVVAVARGDAMHHNPDPALRLEGGDRVAVIGTTGQVDVAERWLAGAT